MTEDRDKLFPGKVRFEDLKNHRYIGRKPIYDFLKENACYMGGQVLDFGCGSMQYDVCFDKADHITGLDVEGADVIFGKNKHIVYYDGINIPFDDESFDSCYSIQAFLCIRDYRHSLQEIHRILRPGGYFIITTDFVLPEMTALPDYTRVTKKRLIYELEEAGFEVIKIKGSTATKHTIRRLKIFCMKYEQHFPWVVCKLYTIFSNMMFVLDKDRYKEGLLPYDYLTLCRKKSG